MTTDADFTAGVDPWLRRLGNLRNIVRQELITRQLEQHLPVHGVVVDIGAGQGTQALRLAAAGRTVVCVEPDARMRLPLETAIRELPPEAHAKVSAYDGALGDLPPQVVHARYAAVLCHGVLMYLPSPDAAIRELATLVAPGGILSVAARNAEAIPWRPAVKGRWQSALEAFAELDQAAADGRDPLYRNEIGVTARADSVDHLSALCEAEGLVVERWYGVRLASDSVPVDEPAPEDPAELAALLDVEARLGCTDPYRRLGAMVHVIARRPSESDSASNAPVAS